MPGDQGRHHQNRADEENRQAQHRGVHGLGNRTRGILGFAGRHAHHFGAGEREHHGQQSRENRRDAAREPAAGHEVAQQRRGIMTGNRYGAEDRQQADHNERDDGEHLD